MQLFSRHTLPTLLLGDGLVFLASFFAATLLVHQTGVTPVLIQQELSLYFGIFVLCYFALFMRGLYSVRMYFECISIPFIYLQAVTIGTVVGYFLLLAFAGQSLKFGVATIFVLIAAFFGSIWRMMIFPRMSRGEGISVLLIGDSPEFFDVLRTFRLTRQYERVCVRHVHSDTSRGGSLSSRVRQAVAMDRYDYIVADPMSAEVQSIMQQLYVFVFSTASTRFIDIRTFYGWLLRREPLGCATDAYMLQVYQSCVHTHLSDSVRRAVDVFVCLILAVPALCAYCGARTICVVRGKKHIYRTEQLVGKSSRPFIRRRFASHTPLGDAALALYEVARGYCSLVGPRPVSTKHVQTYSERVQHYALRHTVRPGLFAPYMPKDPSDTRLNVTEAAVGLSYELYYIRTRSFVMDCALLLSAFCKKVVHM